MSAYTFSLPHATAADIAANAGTPCYVYDQNRITQNLHRIKTAFGVDGKPNSPKLCYAVKANSNFEILRLLNGAGVAFDVVSVGEMQRALHVGAHPNNIIFAGVGKRDDELIAALNARIGWLNVESAQELQVLSNLAVARGLRQRVALRLNPGVDAHTHAYLTTGAAQSKFGVSVGEALRLIAQRSHFPGISIEGLHFHLGSMIAEAEPYVMAMKIALDVVALARENGAQISMLSIGGGFGVAYQPDGAYADLDAIARAVLPLALEANVHLHFEPGRYIVADAGALLTQVLYTKANGGTHYAVVDAAMNDLIRPALYGAKHSITTLQHQARDAVMLSYEVVGPVCESGDFLAHQALLPELKRGDLLLVHHAGAYGMSMSSNYNTRPRAAEILLTSPVTGGVGGGVSWRIIRPRENLQKLFAAEMGY
jgi:diaminopimelate decarboxylase